MIYPLNLEKGYKVGVTAPSAGCETEADLVAQDSGIRHFADLGYPVIETENVRTCHKGRSSEGPTRAKQLMQLFEDPEIRVIIADRGGDFLFELIPYLDFEVLRRNPKWMQGYSDTTGLTFTITTNLDMATVYANNFSSFGMQNWHYSLFDNLKILEGQDIELHSFELYQDRYIEKITGLEEFELEKKVKWINLFPENSDNNSEIVIKGRMIGGCLDVILNLIGTKYDKTKEFIERYREDKILWYLESFDLGSEALTKGLWQLRESGWFEHACGFIFGRPAMFHTDTDTDYKEAVLSVLKELKLPIILEADIGHKPPQLSIINGAIAEVRSCDGKGVIKFVRR
ncbi:MAG TPA: S66 peptidase family protein [Mobilitalea sp.]|nr:S66 peptidase family protein [Mobilitalea sp.]